MKKRKNKISKLFPVIIIPIINLCLVITFACAFAKQNNVGNSNNLNDSKFNKNEKIVSVYFHNMDEVRNVALDEYLLGVVPAEMPPSFEEEALKAQAVAARTFIINKENANNNDDIHKGAVVCTDFNHCKAYITEEEAIAKWGDEWNKEYKEKIKRTIEDTKGLIITYNDEPISAVFHSTSSGRTENSEDVWQSSLPYLRSVESEGEEKSPRYSSKEIFSFEDFKNIILKENPDVTFQYNPDKWIGNVTYNESGSVKTIVIGDKTFKGTDIRSMFSLRSANFKITLDNNVIFNVTGNGHGVGMSQYGANYAAQNGYTFDKILKKYYQGVEISKIP